MTENVWRTETIEGEPRHPKSHWSIKQIVCHPTARLTLFVLTVCLLTVGLASADYQTGAEAYERGDYETALEKLGTLAEEGNPKAQFHLGQMYAKGNGVPHNDEEAANLYKQAAEGGNTLAQFILGLWYEDGRGVPKDKGEAVKWFYKASQQGSDLARYRLSRIFATSTDILQNDEENTNLYREAAEHGYPQAQFLLGMMYQCGWKTPQDDKEAVRYHKAAEAVLSPKWYQDEGCRKRRSFRPV